MPTPPTLDLASLLIPVSGEQPSGPELRQAANRELAGLFFQVRDARRKAIDAERRLRDFASMSEEDRRPSLLLRTPRTGTPSSGARWTRSHDPRTSG